jgi:hypothetical protein
MQNENSIKNDSAEEQSKTQHNKITYNNNLKLNNLGERGWGGQYANKKQIYVHNVDNIP